MKAMRILMFAALIIVFLPTICFGIVLGPYSGTVIDSQTGEPIQGASVLFFWERAVPTPMKAYSEVFEARLVYTDRKGTYHIARIIPNLGLQAVLESTNIIIYQPGYQAYNISISHTSPYGKPDSSFQEKDNIAKLDRIPPNFDHQKHLQILDSALSPIRAYGWEDPIWGRPLTWEKRMELNLKSGILEREEFLKRVEWEERRGAPGHSK
jgi:hypothetical protein